MLDRGGGNWYGHKIVNAGTKWGRPEVATVPFFANEAEYVYVSVLVAQWCSQRFATSSLAGSKQGSRTLDRPASLNG